MDLAAGALSFVEAGDRQSLDFGQSVLRNRAPCLLFGVTLNGHIPNVLVRKRLQQNR